MNKNENTEPNSIHGRLMANATFENFVVGSCNEFSVAACHAAVEKPGAVYNPLYIYGQTGTGKTHLLHAMANAFLAAGHKKIMLQTGELFTNDLISAIRTGSTLAFRDTYRKVDVLMIDDIHYIAGKDRTQEEFFHTFNALYEMNKQIILTADRSPCDLNNLMERLRSRFGSSLISELSLPDQETRLAFIAAKTMQAGIALDDETTGLLASRENHSFRWIAGALVSLQAHSEQTGRVIDAAFAADVLRDRLQGAGEEPAVQPALE